MVSTTFVVVLVLVCGALSESPTAPPEFWADAPASEDARQDQTSEEPIDVLKLAETDPEAAWNYEMSKEPIDDSVWPAYSPEVYPLFRKAIRELAASEHGILIFWDTINRPELTRAFFEPVFNAYNRLVSEGVSSTTEESRVSEADDVYTVEDQATSSEDSGTEYHAGVSHNSEAGVYYTTESPMVETMLTDEAVYASTMSPEAQDEVVYASTSPEAHDEAVYPSTMFPETQEDSSEESSHLYMTSAGDVYEATAVDENEESSVDPAIVVSESDWENVLRRSGEIAEHRQSEGTPDHQCEGCPLQVGSIRGIPGVHFPNYDDIPITSFSCADKHVPGFYADLETGCQVFHVCWPHRRESFLCPIGTLFNQPILACDYWYSTNCSLSSLYQKPTEVPIFSSTEEYTERPHEEYERPVERPHEEYERPVERPHEDYERPVQRPTEVYERPVEIPDEQPHVDLDWFRVKSKFIPVKSKVTVYTKHSSKKPGLKYVVKQKHNVMPLVEDFLQLTRNIAQSAVRLIPQVQVKVVKPVVTKAKVKVSPAAKLRPCLKVKDVKVEYHRPTPLVKKPQPLPHLDPRFIVKPVVGLKPVVVQKPVVHIRKELPKVHVKVVKPVAKVAFKTSKHHAPGIVLKALDVAGNVLQRDILDLTRQAMAESHVKVVKSKH